MSSKKSYGSKRSRLPNESESLTQRGGPIPPRRGPPREENNFFHHDERYFKKVESDPALFQMNVNHDDFWHLMNDDTDHVSKIEVVYKILKQQLRDYQKQLISLKEEEKREKKEARAKAARSKSPKKGLSQKELKNFARYLKHF